MPTVTSDCHLRGKVRRSAEVNDFLLTEIEYAPLLTLPVHSHDNAYACLVLEGAYTECYERKSRFCCPSTLIFHPPGESHSDQFIDSAGAIFNFQVGARWLEHISDYSSVFVTPSEVQGGSVARIMKRMYQEFRDFDSVSALAIESLALELVVGAARRPGKNSRDLPPRWLRAAEELLHAHFHERLTLTSIAESVGIHPVHLSRVFHVYYGCTISEYTRRLRVEFASRHLSYSDTPLVELALAAGFSSQSHFSTTFKQVTGFTPAEYRNIFRAR